MRPCLGGAAVCRASQIKEVPTTGLAFHLPHHISPPHFAVKQARPSATCRISNRQYLFLGMAAIFRATRYVERVIVGGLQDFEPLIFQPCRFSTFLGKSVRNESLGFSSATLFERKFLICSRILSLLVHRRFRFPKVAPVPI